MLMMMLFIICPPHPNKLQTPAQHIVVDAKTCSEIASKWKAISKNSQRYDHRWFLCCKAEREKKPPTERGDLSTSNEENGSEAVSPQSVPLVSQHVKHSQHDTEDIKV